MDEGRIEDVLSTCERAVTEGGRIDLRELGFWRAVDAIKRQPELSPRFARRIGAIGEAAFLRTVHPVFSPARGTALLGAVLLAGLAAVTLAGALPRRWRAFALLAGTGALLGTSHGLTHLLVGRLLGIRFSHWFLDGPLGVQPGLKVEYGSYLRVDPRARAVMHASGALITKAVPFLVLGLARRSGMPRWVGPLLVGIGLAQIATDVTFSVHHADWKKFRRELRFARELAARSSSRSPVAD